MVNVVTPEGNHLLVCYSCYQDGDFKLEWWLSDDPENYPAKCECCRGTMVAPGDWRGPDRDER